MVEYDFVAWVQEQDVPWTPADVLEGVPERVLSADASLGRHAGVLDVPAGYRREAGAAVPVSTEFYVLEGALRFGAETLAARAGRPAPSARRPA